MPSLPERPPQQLEAGDRDQLLEALSHDTLAQKRNRALILLLSTGARSSEILRFDRSEWKLERLWATSSNRLPIAGSQHVYRQLA